MSVGARRALWGLAAGPTAAPSVGMRKNGLHIYSVSARVQFWAQAWVPWVVAASITASVQVSCPWI
eukprot:238660-Amorphochlora_amoeboformis.AAC.2